MAPLFSASMARSSPSDPETKMKGTSGRVLEQDLERRRARRSRAACSPPAPDRVAATGERVAKVGFRHDVPPLDRRVRPWRAQLDQLGVVRIVFQQHEAQCRGPSSFHSAFASSSLIARDTVALWRRLWKMGIAGRLCGSQNCDVEPRHRLTRSPKRRQPPWRNRPGSSSSMTIHSSARD